MTQEEAAAKQVEISKNYDLSFWYGTGCDRCCGVFPKFMTTDTMNPMCWYECEVCGKRTEPQPMPWLAKAAWNKGQFLEKQIRMF